MRVKEFAGYDPNLELGLIIRQVVERLQRQHLKHPGDDVIWLTASITIVPLLMNHLQQRVKRPPARGAV